MCDVLRLAALAGFLVWVVQLAGLDELHSFEALALPGNAFIFAHVARVLVEVEGRCT